MHVLLVRMIFSFEWGEGGIGKHDHDLSIAKVTYHHEEAEALVILPVFVRVVFRAHSTA